MAKDDENPDLDDLGDLGDGTGADDEADDDLDEAGDDGQDANPPADTPAPTAEDWARLQRKAKRQEERITRLLKAQGKAVRRNAAGGLEDDGDDDGKGKTDDRWKSAAVKNAAAAALSAAGFNGTAKQAARLTRLMDLDGVEPDEDGMFDLEDEVEALAEEYPALFAKASAGSGKRVPRVRTAPARSGAPTDDPTAKTTRALLREAGFTVGRGR